MSIEVKTSYGWLRGIESVGFNENKFYSFKGIPYAKPPIGNLRFKAPVPIDPWEDVRDASKHGPPCQCCNIDGTLMGSEDCLYLNVYTPSIETDETYLRPVMVFIHGGSFIEGNGNSSRFGPNFLISKDIVLVTFNYRLGALGFIHFTDPLTGVPGNAGLKDMVMTLKWVQTNIKHFSGDPNNVTIFGESAGAASVHYLILSPMAKGLFHKAIIQSGVANAEWALGRRSPQTFAKVFELEETDDRAIYEFLMSLSSEKIVYGQYRIRGLENFSDEGFIIWSPVIEKFGDSDTKFLSIHPMEIIKSGNYNHVPIIFGYNSEEGLLFLSASMSPEIYMYPPFKNHDYFLPLNFRQSLMPCQIKKAGEDVKRFYYGDVTPDNNNLMPYVTYMTDRVFLFPLFKALQHHLRTTKESIYLYKFCVDTPYSLLKNLLNINFPGAIHGAELSYLFSNEAVYYMPAEDTLEKKTIDRLVQLWTSFARNGVPEIWNADFQWKTTDITHLYCLNIDEEIKCVEKLDIDRINFWQKIYCKCKHKHKQNI